ncbi:MAG TPA: pyruvate kinase [Rhodospirillales bacterium]|nr:pyruvate kinase [Rhodospirillales bacterium]
MSRTKIVATIGPATDTAKALKDLSLAGMSMARLNGSHADLDWHAKTIALIRETLPGTPILLDIPGRKIRTVALAHEPSFEKGDTVILTTDSSHDGHEKVPVNYAGLHDDLNEGVTIMADDGTLRFTVSAIRGRDIHCRAETPGTLRGRKGINVPYVTLHTELVSQCDREMMSFARRHGIDFVGISFVESTEHVEAIRALAGGGWPRIVSKIENRGGMENMRAVIEASDAVMIDRGDLSVETELETLAVAQKSILSAAAAAAKPVIVATEMLHTMIDNSFPTKAEVSDITNAVLDGCSATMLSGETAIGRHPVEAVSVMRRVTEAAEAHLQQTLDGPGRNRGEFESVPEAMAEAIAFLCRSLPVTKIVALTRSGYAARTIAAFRPRQPIIAVSDDAMAAQSFNMLAGTTGVHTKEPFSRTSLDYLPRCLEKLWRDGAIVGDDLILVTAVTFPQSGNRMNLIETYKVDDLRNTLGWK